MANNTVDQIFNKADFIREILIRIPAKQLLKLKCVCKQWRAIISDLQFAYDHTRQNPNPPHLGLYFYKTVIPFSTIGLKTIPNNGISRLPPLDFLNYFRIVDSCNGLALALHLNVTIKTYVVCNPTTKKMCILPKAIDENFTIWRVYELLVFDPEKSPHFKVIVVYYTKIGAQIVMMFSSEEGSWKEILFHNSLGVPATRIIFFNGALHWLTTNNIHYEFVVNKEELETNVIAQNLKIRTNNVRYFGESGGCLYLAIGGSLTYMCSIFEMEWDTHLWISRYRINFKDKISKRIGDGSKFYVLDIVKNSNRRGLTLVLATPGGFVSYDIETGITQIIRDFLPSEFEVIPKELTNLGSYSYRYIESLFPILVYQLEW